MEENKTIVYQFNLQPNDLQNKNIIQFIENECYKKLNNNIYDDYFIKDIKNITICNDHKINSNTSISVKCYCISEIINPIIGSVVNIKINDSNKMGFSYKYKKICIFIPNHFANNIKVNDTINVTILGKRIEENIICIAKQV